MKKYPKPVLISIGADEWNVVIYPSRSLSRTRDRSSSSARRKVLAYLIYLYLRYGQPGHT